MINSSPTSATLSSGSRKSDDDKFSFSNLTHFLRRDSNAATEAGAVAMTASTVQQPAAAAAAGQQHPPDLSYLTAEERAIIENVMHRQQDEVSREVSFLK